MVPLGAGAAVVATASAAARVAQGRQGAAASVAAASATVGVVAVTVTVNEPASERFTSDMLTDSETAELLRRWARWHDLRVALGLASTVAAALALARHDA
jgi:hypothetical protein